MPEYWLQKKTIGGWSMVTSYTELEQAQRNYISCVGNGMSGYSWRLVRVETIKEDMLNDVVEVEPAIIEQQSRWGDLRNPSVIKIQPVQDAPKADFGTDLSGWNSFKAPINPEANGEASKPDGRGAKPGSICLMHHGLKKRCRTMPEELDMLLSQGWQRGGPRTQFEG